MLRNSWPASTTKDLQKPFSLLCSCLSLGGWILNWPSNNLSIQCIQCQIKYLPESDITSRAGEFNFFCEVLELRVFGSEAISMSVSISEPVSTEDILDTDDQSLFCFTDDHRDAFDFCLFMAISLRDRDGKEVIDCFDTNLGSVLFDTFRSKGFLSWDLSILYVFESNRLDLWSFLARRSNSRSFSMFFKSRLQTDL